MKEIEYIKFKEDTESYLNGLYKAYVLEDDRNLDSKAIELKYHLKYLVDYLKDNDMVEYDKMYVEQTALERRVEQLEKEVNMLKSMQSTSYTYGIR